MGGLRLSQFPDQSGRPGEEWLWCLSSSSGSPREQQCLPDPRHTLTCVLSHYVHSGGIPSSIPQAGIHRLLGGFSSSLLLPVSQLGFLKDTTQALLSCRAHRPWFPLSFALWSVGSITEGWASLSSLGGFPDAKSLEQPWVSVPVFLSCRPLLPAPW